MGERQVRLQDPWAEFETLYREHHRRVYAIALRFTRDADRAEEIVQDAFVRAWRSLPSFNGDSRLSTWLHSVAVNAALDGVRARSARGADRSRRGPRSLRGGGRTRDAGGGPRSRAGGGRAPDGAREIVILHYIEGYPCGDRGAARDRRGDGQVAAPSGAQAPQGGVDMSEIDRDRELEARLAKAPREAEPRRDLWPSVERAIAQRRSRAGVESASRAARGGLLRAAAPDRGGPLALFVGGVLVGQRWGETAPAPPPAPGRPALRRPRRFSGPVPSTSRRSPRLDESVAQWSASRASMRRSDASGRRLGAVRLPPRRPPGGPHPVHGIRGPNDGEEPTVRF